MGTLCGRQAATFGAANAVRIPPEQFMASKSLALEISSHLALEQGIQIVYWQKVTEP